MYFFIIGWAVYYLFRFFVLVLQEKSILIPRSLFRSLLHPFFIPAIAQFEWGLRTLPEDPEVVFLYAFGHMLFLGGFLLVIAAHLALGHDYHAAVSSQAPVELVTEMPYTIVRHPLYAGVLLMWFGFVAAVGTWPFFLYGLLVIPVVIWQIKREEKMLAHRFQEKWERYTAKTHSRLLYGIW